MLYMTLPLCRNVAIVLAEPDSGKVEVRSVAAVAQDMKQKILVYP